MIKKAPGIDGIKAEIYLRIFQIFPNLITTIYNQCLKKKLLSTKVEGSNIIPIIKPGKENSTDP